jgi:hypothetical protein
MAQISHATINVINGEEFGDSPQASVHVLGKRGAHGGETLVVFLDLPGATPQLCSEITRALTDGYARAPGGVTSALRLAIKLASDKAAQFNKGVLPTQRVEGSISCAVFTDASVVIAQTGPAIAYVRGADGAFERIEPPATVASQIVGAATNADVNFDNVTHQHGNVYVLTGQRSFTIPRDDLVSACMGKGDARMAAGYLNANVKQGRMAGIAFGAVEREGVFSPPPKQRAPAEPVVKQREPAYAHETAFEAATERGGFGDFASSASTRAADVSADMKAGLNQAAQSVKRSLSQFGGKMLPDPTPIENKAQRSKTTLFALIATAVLVPILVVGVAIPAYYQFSGEAERREAQKAINASVETAKAARAPAEVKGAWAQVIQQVDAYEKANPSPEEAARYAPVRAEARTQVDALFKIARVKPATIAQFELPGRRRIAASAIGVYALNVDIGTAEFMTISPDKAALIGKSVPIQFTGNVSGGLALSDIAWATNQDSRWRTEGAVLFSPQKVYEYTRATGRAVPLQVAVVDGKSPAKLSAGELYNNQAYLLDSGSGQIWRYPIGANGLGRGSTYFRSPFEPIKQGVDLAIDGAIYVLSNNGSVQKFFSRQPQRFDISGLPEPMGRPVAIAVSGEDPARGNVFVLDAQTGAVLVFDKSGQFLKQFRGGGDELINACDMAFDSATNTLFVSSGDRLFSFKIA